MTALTTVLSQSCCEFLSIVPKMHWMINVQSKVTAEVIASIAGRVDVDCHLKPFPQVSLHDSSAEVELELFNIVLDFSTTG